MVVAPAMATIEFGLIDMDPVINNGQFDRTIASVGIVNSKQNSLLNSALSSTIYMNGNMLMLTA